MDDLKTPLPACVPTTTPKRMFAITVFSEPAGYIVIEQPNDNDPPAYITVHPDQVPVLIKWLAEASA